MTSKQIDKETTYNGLLNKAIASAKDLLTSFAFQDRLLADFSTAFGSNYNRSEAKELVEQWQEGEFEPFPEIVILPSATINGANGAYSVDTDKIYIAEEFLESNADNASAIAALILEEYGHFVDAQINTVDAAGDEGDIFSRLVRFEQIDPNLLQQLKVENDLAVVNIDGKQVTIEQWKVIGSDRSENPLDAGIYANGNNTIEGRGGNDFIYGGGGNDILKGELGDDTVYGEWDNDFIYGGEGNDVLYGGEGPEARTPRNITEDGNDVLDGGNGNDTLDGGTGNDELRGGNGNDELRGGTGSDKLFAGDGDDTVFGWTGNDLIYGEDGGNDLWGQQNNDTIIGGNGNDTLRGHQGNDSLSGSFGSDLYFFDTDYDSGLDVISEGNLSPGIDIFDFSATTTKTINIDLSHRTQQRINSNLSIELDFLAWEAIENVKGGHQNDNIIGNLLNNQIEGISGDDLIYGGAGADTLLGGFGNDKHYGEDGNDLLVGDAGRDTLTGGKGADCFRFRNNTTYLDAVDVITDFHIFEGDKIEISKSGFGGITDTSNFNFNSMTGSLYFGAQEIAILSNSNHVLFHFDVTTGITLI